VKISVTWKPTTKELAEAFCELHSDEQAKFFVEVAACADDWPATVSHWHRVGRHLAKETEARSMLNEIEGGADE
jgi:hypothetical protein